MNDFLVNLAMLLTVAAASFWLFGRLFDQLARRGPLFARIIHRRR